jgi:hypothetical protein
MSIAIEAAELMERRPPWLTPPSGLPSSTNWLTSSHTA